MDKCQLDSISVFYGRQSGIEAMPFIGNGVWLVDFELGEEMYRLIVENQCCFGVEVGAGVGYSTVWIGLAMKETGGKLISFEHFPPKIELLRKHLLEFGLENWNSDLL